MITGPRVTLRPLRAEDEGALYAIAADFDTWEERNDAVPNALTRELFGERFAKRLTADGDELSLGIEANGHLVGRVDLFGIDPFVRQAEVGIALAADARGKGYGSEALRLLVEFAFVRRNMRRIVLMTLATNSAALRSYAKVGFVEEGRRREAAWVRGEYVDMVDMGLLRSEFRAT